MGTHTESKLFFIERQIGYTSATGEHFHNLYEFYYLKNGTATYLINDKIYHLVKGDIVVIPPNTLHKTVSSSDAERERILFYLDKSYLESIPAAQSMLPLCPIFCHEDNHLRLKSIFLDMLTEFHAANSRIYLESMICELLILLQRNAKKIVPEQEYSALPEIISSILAHITANYASDLTLQGVSGLFYTNPSYLSRLFKQHTGFTFCNYLNNYRIKEANKLLSETSKPITVIALECGFNSLNNFCKCYKKIMNTSPLAYRKYITQRDGAEHGEV